MKKRRSGVLAFKLIPWPAGLHPVTPSCISSPRRPVRRAHLSRDFHLGGISQLRRGCSRLLLLSFTPSQAFSHCEEPQLPLVFTEELTPVVSLPLHLLSSRLPLLLCRSPPSRHVSPLHQFPLFHFPLMTSRTFFPSSASFLRLAISVLAPCHVLSSPLCLRRECHLMRAGLRALEYRRRAARCTQERMSGKETGPSSH